MVWHIRHKCPTGISLSDLLFVFFFHVWRHLSPKMYDTSTHNSAPVCVARKPLRQFQHFATPAEFITRGLESFINLWLWDSFTGYRAAVLKFGEYKLLFGKFGLGSLVHTSICSKKANINCYLDFEIEPPISFRFGAAIREKISAMSVPISIIRQPTSCLITCRW